MATIVGHLQARLSATSAAFAADMAKASKATKGFGSEFKSLGSTAAMVGGAFGIGFMSIQGIIGTLKGAVSGMADLIAEQIQVVDSAIEVANRLGVTTDTLLAYHHAAKMANVESSQLDGALTRMAKAVSAAADKGGKLDEPFISIGLAADDLIGMSIDKQFESIASAISRIENPADRARAAIAIFGKSGAQLMGLLSGGQSGLQDTIARYHELAGILSDQQAADIASVADSVDELTTSWEGLGRSLAARAAPALRDTFDLFTELLIATRNRPPTAFGAIDAIQDAWMGLAKKMADREMQNALGGKDGGGGVADSVNEHQASIDAMLKSQREAADMFGMTAAQIRLYRAEMMGASEDELRELKTLNDLIEMMEDQKKAADAEAAATKARTKAVQDYIKTLEEENAVIGMSAGELAERRAKELGATPAQAAKAKAIADSTDKKNRSAQAKKEAIQRVADEKKAMQQSAESIKEEIMSPGELFNRRLFEVKELQLEGLLTEEDVAKKAALLRQQIYPQAEQGGIGAGGAAAFGSSEAASIILRSMNMPGAAKAPEEKTAKNTEEIKKNGAKQVVVLERLVANTAPLADIVEVDL